MDSNFTTNHQLNHRTIRFFQDKPIPDELMDHLLTVMNRTATSNGLQTASVIRVTDDDKKQQISEVSNQAYIAKAPELFIFLVDAYRMKEIAQASGSDGDDYRSMNVFFQGVADAYLNAQNLTTAIESFGLGATFLGSILNDSQRMIDILDLPELTFPILGVIFGYPDDDPELKPRMPLDLKVGENGYPHSEDILADLAPYDEEMTHYYDTRQKNQRSDSYTKQIIRKVENPSEKRNELLRVVKNQGFDLNIED